MKSILVVDDVPVVRLVIGRILKKAGYTILEAGNGTEALAMAEAQPVDVMITDMWMPGLDGMHLLKAMKARFPRMALVGMSGGSPDSTIIDSLDAANESGAVVAVMKPVDREELLEAIEEAVARTH